MRVKYRCAVSGAIRLQFAFDMPAGPIRFQFERGEHDLLTHVSAIVSVPDRSQWPVITPTPRPGIRLELRMQSPAFEVVRQQLRSAEAILALFRPIKIDIENAEEIWMPDSPEEKNELECFGFSRRVERLQPHESPHLAFDLVGRAFLAAHQAQDIETALSFFRKGSEDLYEQRYIEAAVDFLYMIETLYANGKFRTAEVQRMLLGHTALQEDIASVVNQGEQVTSGVSDQRVRDGYRKSYVGKSAEEVTKHIVQLRGVLHHHSKKSRWHPDEHAGYGADALFLQHLCSKTGLRLVKPVLFATEHEQRYLELFREARRPK